MLPLGEIYLVLNGTTLYLRLTPLCLSFSIYATISTVELFDELKIGLLKSVILVLGAYTWNVCSLVTQLDFIDTTLVEQGPFLVTDCYLGRTGFSFSILPPQELQILEIST